MNDNYVFYAFKVNGHTAAVLNTPEEALDALSIRLKEDASDIYTIEPIDGIFRMMERIADFEGRYDDIWMEDAIQIACQMLFDKRKLMDAKKPDKNPPKKTDSKDKH
jgi:hypothetical protein